MASLDCDKKHWVAFPVHALIEVSFSDDTSHETDNARSTSRRQCLWTGCYLVSAALCCNLIGVE